MYLYITEPAWVVTSNFDELFIAYGKQHWLYRHFWDSPSEADQEEVGKLYSIDPELDLIDPQL